MRRNKYVPFIETIDSNRRSTKNISFHAHTIALIVFADTQKYVVTFTTSQSYIEVPGWRKGDIAFSFRTTGERAILLYQPPIRPHHPCFMVALTSGKTLDNPSSAQCISSHCRLTYILEIPDAFNGEKAPSEIDSARKFPGIFIIVCELPISCGSIISIAIVFFCLFEGNKLKIR